MKTYIIKDKFYISENTNTIYLPERYKEQTVNVYVNGMPCNEGEHYNTIDELTLEFVNTLLSGDEIILEVHYTSNKPMSVVSNNSRNPNTLFKKYSSEEKLKFNHNYNVNIIHKNEPIKWSFTSKLSPLLSNIKKIRLDTGDILSSVADEIILRIIYMNSKEGIELYESTIDDNTTDITYPKVLNSWVRYKTDMDLIHAAYLTISGKYGTVAKKIGPIDISQTIKLPYINEMLSRFKDKFKQIQSSLTSSTATPLSAVKAGDKDYPISERMSF